MSELKAMAQRISDLEIHMSHQDNTIQDLSDITAKQWDTIDVMVRKIDLLKDRIAAMEADKGSPNPGDPPPPHF